MIRATFELEPPGAAEALARELTTGMRDGPGFARGRVLSDDGRRVVVELPAEAWGSNLTLLMSALVAGEASESRDFDRCRLVDLQLPAGTLPGPAFSGDDRVKVGAVIKPSIGLDPDETAEVAAQLARGGACLIKDDDLLGDPPWCPRDERVRAVADALHPSVTYFVNISGPPTTLLTRAERAIELGASGLMVNAFAQGLDSLLCLRNANLGVPLLAHRAGSGPVARHDRFGATPAVLALLLRLAGADLVLVGAVDGKLFDSEPEIRASLEALRRPLAGVRVPTALIGGGIGPENAKAQAEAAAGGPVTLLLGARTYEHPDGVAAGVRAVCESLG